MVRRRRCPSTFSFPYLGNYNSPMSFNLKAKLRKLDDDTIQRLFQRAFAPPISQTQRKAEANNAVVIDPSVEISTATSEDFDVARPHTGAATVVDTDDLKRKASVPAETIRQLTKHILGKLEVARQWRLEGPAARARLWIGATVIIEPGAYQMSNQASRGETLRCR